MAPWHSRCDWFAGRRSEPSCERDEGWQGAVFSNTTAAALTEFPHVSTISKLLHCRWSCRVAVACARPQLNPMQTLEVLKIRSWRWRRLDRLHMDRKILSIHVVETHRMIRVNESVRVQTASRTSEAVELPLTHPELYEEWGWSCRIGTIENNQQRSLVKSSQSSCVILCHDSQQAPSSSVIGFAAIAARMLALSHPRVCLDSTI